ncbi:MAG: carboxypeptidase [Phycisphaerae bacterium]|jgi:carboxypeptidase C (cathepsin A)|nr:carboxypeptidase [Phycisphaerae bacterium]
MQSTTAIVSTLALLVGSAAALAQAPVGPAELPKTAEKATEKPVEKNSDKADATPQPIRIVADAETTKEDSVTINGKLVPYRVHVGTQPVWDAENKPIASVFYTYYERTDVTDPARRPLLISFNGGPGSASVWMHLAYTGPRMLRIDDEGFPIQPYGIVENPHSILDVADIVFVDPVNTGFSRILEKADRSNFFGVDQDINYLSQWIRGFVTRKGRWLSPKYLIGESYGTTRVAGLAARLQDTQWMYLNGVILVSPTSLGIAREGPVGKALTLPYFAATAWYHKALAPDLLAKDLDVLLPEVEAFTIDSLIPALARGGSLEPKRRDELIAAYARFAGLDPSVVREYNGAVPAGFFWKELLRKQGLTIGRLDSRYRGIDRQDSGTSPEFDAAMAAWNHAFAPAVNHYLREVLGYRTDLDYAIFGQVGPWPFDGDRTGEALRQAMGANPFLHVMVQSGYYDGATDYFSAKYTMWNMDPAGRFQERMTWKGYRSGHMMYLRKVDLATASADIRAFIARSTPKEGESARR